MDKWITGERTPNAVTLSRIERVPIFQPNENEGTLQNPTTVVEIVGDITEGDSQPISTVDAGPPSSTPPFVETPAPGKDRHGWTVAGVLLTAFAALIALATLANASLQGRPHDEMEFFLWFLLLVDAGGDTTRNLVGAGMHALFEHGDELTKLRRDPASSTGHRDSVMVDVVCG